MPRVNINKLENKIIVSVDPKIYPLESIYGAVYVFLDRAYIFLDGDPKKEIHIHLKGKRKLKNKEKKNLKDEFLNELLNCSLRYQISKNNRKIREYIVGAALIGMSEEIIEEPTKLEKKEWEKDPLGIAIPWEEKYAKTSNVKKGSHLRVKIKKKKTKKRTS